MEKLFYTISEVADLLSESTSCIRFWSNAFPKKIKPRRNAKGNRLFTAEDIELLKQVQFLLKTEGMTIEGAARQLEGEDKTKLRKAKALETLKEIRSQLVQIRKALP